MAVPAFAGKVIAGVAAFTQLGIKHHALIDKPLHAVTRMAGDKLRRVAIDNTGTGNQGIFDMRGDAVRFIKHRRNTALRVEC